MRILYGINGEGMGHAMRSAEIIKGLSKNNEIKIVAGGKAANHLKKIAGLKEVSYLSFVTKNGKVSSLKTFFVNLLKLPFFLYHFFTILIECIIKRPKVIITDFEPLSAYTGLILRIPVISFDNQHIITDTKIPNNKEKSSKFLYKIIVHLMVPFPKEKIITSFFYPKVLTKNAVLVSPVIREIITKQKIKEGGELVVYLSIKNDLVLKTLEKSKNKCIIYGKTNLKSSKFIKIKNFDEEQFAHDMANARAVICNAGMTTLSEAIYLKKPVLCIPVSGQIEQEINAHYLQKIGYGSSKSEINKKIIKEFLNNLDVYRANLRKANFSNNKILETIKRAIKRIIS